MLLEPRSVRFSTPLMSACAKFRLIVLNTLSIPPVALRLFFDDSIAKPNVERIVARTASHGIRALAAGQKVVSAASDKTIVTGFSIKPVITRADRRCDRFRRRHR